MRWYRDHEGTQQVYLKDAEIDEITEEELRKAGLMPTVDTCRVDIEVFVERHLGAQLDLGAALGDDVLGVTELRGGEPARILINRDLTGSAFEIDEYSGTLGRWRVTVAHEGVHVLLHGLLYELNPNQQTMFDAETRRRLRRPLLQAGHLDRRAIEGSARVPGKPGNGRAGHASFCRRRGRSIVTPRADQRGDASSPGAPDRENGRVGAGGHPQPRGRGQPRDPADRTNRSPARPRWRPPDC